MKVQRMNERLRSAIHAKGITPTELAAMVNVDPKSVERWITKGRNPYAKTRAAVALALQQSENYLWPDALPEQKAKIVSESELVHTYAKRNDVPAELWARIFRQATRHIGVLAYAGLFLPEGDSGLVPLLKAKAAEGVKVSILLGNPDSAAVALRGEEEGVGEGMRRRIEAVLPFYQQLEATPGIWVGFHETTLYNSIYWCDSEMLVNTHVLGCYASHAPVMHLKELPGGGMFRTFTECFERVLANSVNIWTGQQGTMRP